ncbi:MAG: hypothetical protein H7336_07045 [Bacteriovorax sp.]|nr:hypothetical protein [Bacteriovorax sp.]
MLTGLRVFFLMFSLFLFQSPLSAAEESNVDTLSSLTINKDEIFTSLDNLRKEGKISDTEYQKAKKELAGMNDDQIKGIKDKAVTVIKKDPSKAEDIVNGKKIDMKEFEKQMEEAGIEKK